MTKHELQQKNSALAAENAELRAELSKLRMLLASAKPAAKNGVRPAFKREVSAAEQAAHDAWRARCAAARKAAMQSGESVKV